MHLVWPKVGDQEQRRANLLALTQSVPCYGVTMARGENVSRAVSTVLRTMEAEGGFENWGESPDVTVGAHLKHTQS